MVAERLEYGVEPGVEPACRVSAFGVDHQRHEIGVRRPGPGGSRHGAVEPALGLKDARRVDQDDLALALKRDAEHRRPGRLRLVRDDGDLGADQRVDQRGLAGCSGAPISATKPQR